jgi:spore coat protein A
MPKASILLLISAFLFILLSASFLNSAVSAQTPSLIDASTIPQWVNQLEGPPPIFVPLNVTDSTGKLIRQEYTIKISQFTQQILPVTDANGKSTGFPATTVWGYEGEAKNLITGENLGIVKSTPGCSFEALNGVPTQVKWVNNLVDSQGKPLPHLFAIDPTIHWANPKNLQMPTEPVTAPSFPPGYTEAQSPVPIVTHLHGGEIAPVSDGNPEAWWTPDGLHGPAYGSAVPTDSNAAVFVYPNTQPPTTLWFHDHALGVTNLNVMAGLAGFYLIRNSSDEIAKLLPSGEFEVPLVIQDRTFQTDGSLYVSNVGVNSEVHPYWVHFFVGNTIMVNGKVWPNMDVKQGVYRLRVLNGSPSRFYEIAFSNGMSFIQIGSDGGYLKAPAKLTSLVLGPAERADILVDFSGVAAGQKVTMLNSLADPTEPVQMGQIIQFTVNSQKGAQPQTLPTQLNPNLQGTFPTLPAPSVQRTLTMTTVGDPNKPLEMLLDGQEWNTPVSEKPTLGSTEQWTIVDPTLDAHPIHIHLVQFQLVKRQAVNSSAYRAEWSALNGEVPLNHSTVNVASLDKYLIGSAAEPTPSEQGWKDTIIVYPDEAVTIRVRFAPQDGSNFSFDATASPGYVWHCHLLPHEDNEMMRPYMLVTAGQTNIWLLPVVVAVAIVLAFLGVLVYRNYLKRI